MDVPVWYLGTVEDRGLPVVVQRMQVGMAREMGGKVEHRELRTSHSPFLSRPEETTGLVLEAVESFMGTSIDNRPKGGVRAVVISPAPRALAARDVGSDLVSRWSLATYLEDHTWSSAGYKGLWRSK